MSRAINKMEFLKRDRRGAKQRKEIFLKRKNFGICSKAIQKPAYSKGKRNCHSQQKRLHQQLINGTVIVFGFSGMVMGMFVQELTAQGKRKEEKGGGKRQGQKKFTAEKIHRANYTSKTMR